MILTDDWNEIAFKYFSKKLLNNHIISYENVQTSVYILD